MPIAVKSEIQPLKTIMLHRPGRELENLVPNDLERLLFDDIPFLKIAQQEHDSFADLLSVNGIKVVYLETLMADVLKDNPCLKSLFIDDFITESSNLTKTIYEATKEYLMSIEDEKQLVLKTMEGVKASDLKGVSASPLSKLISNDTRFILDPIPNLYFTRDPFASIGNGVSLNRMYSQTRSRETLYGKYILKYHQLFKDSIRFYYDRDLPFSIEGGDILNLSSTTLAVGISQRTTPEAIELLADNIFSDEHCDINTILAIEIPNIRAFMHLDTVFTQADYDKFVVHPGILKHLHIYTIHKGNAPHSIKVNEFAEGFEACLCNYLKLDKVNLIPCGGNDFITAEREQWNDGSNTLCIRPGTVIAYDRNQKTNSLLRYYGINVLEIPSSELSRGRGGPRCMSMPLERQPLE